MVAILLVFTSLTIGLIGPEPVYTETKDDEAVVKKLFQKYAEDWNKGNLKGVFAFLADDVVQMPPDNPIIYGKKDLMADWKKYMDDYSSRWDPKITDIAIAGDLAYLRGPFVEKRTPKAGGDPETQKGDSVWVMRRDASGEWKLVLELWFGRGWE
jgi:ketosteroid isomerase-like protein